MPICGKAGLGTERRRKFWKGSSRHITKLVKGSCVLVGREAAGNRAEPVGSLSLTLKWRKWGSVSTGRQQARSLRVALDIPCLHLCFLASRLEEGEQGSFSEISSCPCTQAYGWTGCPTDLSLGQQTACLMYVHSFFPLSSPHTPRCVWRGSDALEGSDNLGGRQKPFRSTFPLDICACLSFLDAIKGRGPAWCVSPSCVPRHCHPC